jgi:hypothetical protein
MKQLQVEILHLSVDDCISEKGKIRNYFDHAADWIGGEFTVGNHKNEILEN